MNLNEIKEYYEARKLKIPNVWEALGWAIAELGEVYEVLMSMGGGWVRNNPEKHPAKTKEDLAEELGDVILMLMVAGWQQGVDPLDAIDKKMKRKIIQSQENNPKLERMVLEGNSKLEIIEINPSGGMESIKGLDLGNVYYDEVKGEWILK